ncbi:uncharacterized protein A4U43_C10F4380 [Asparagus officinalis]|uniref:Endoglucanase n=1 Tax=Asparagus officinalis TaxID=4686 RepID=A0A5P1E3V0_ASPOF|nr:uncharacterized protein A4U43_C10F4380 [Asparagus officinalis]
MFFEGQRSGKLPSSQRMAWRKNSALQDGQYIEVDLVGGYYDAGDNLKFGFPMAYTTTILSWSIIEFGMDMGPEIFHAMAAVRWGTDYLLKATSEPNKVYVGVGDPLADHNCWQRPEDMDTARTVYVIDSQNPGSEVAAETAAALVAAASIVFRESDPVYADVLFNALAAASIVFRESDPVYADVLFNRSVMVFEFADTYQGSYNTSLGGAVCPFYCDWSGYEDELIWGAAWIYRASNSTWHWEYVARNILWLESSKGAGVGEFGWDDKHAGIYVLLYKDFLKSQNQHLVPYHKKAQDFVCTVLPESPTKSVNYSHGGLLFKPGGSNMQNPTALSFLLVVFAQYINENNQIVTCNNGVIAPPSRLIELAKSQVDYILGDNPLQMSYMVGYGDKFPQRIHHRASSLPSMDVHPEKITCKGGTPFYLSSQPNPNLLVGAIVGGPDEDDQYLDLRSMFTQSEPTTYINAPMVGLLAYFHAKA